MKEMQTLPPKCHVHQTVDYLVKPEKQSDHHIQSTIKSEQHSDHRTQTVIKSEKLSSDQIESAKMEPQTHLQSNDKSEIESFLIRFARQTYPNAILRSKHLQLAFWKKDEVFFLFDMRDADKEGSTIKGKEDKSSCPYVAWFDSINGLLAHINSNELDVIDENFEFISFELKAKIENSSRKTWYNFSPVNDMPDHWMIHSLHGSLHQQYGLTSCLIALTFASTLQPSNWSSSMLDSSLKYGTKLYKKSVKATNSTDLKLSTIVTPFVIGCYEFSFTAGLFKCGANEHYVLQTGIASLFTQADFGIISSKGYTASIWQQNNSYFIFDPQLNGMAALSRFSNISMVSNHFLSHIRTGMAGVNVFEIFKVTKQRHLSLIPSPNEFPIQDFDFEYDFQEQKLSGRRRCHFETY